MKKIVAGMLCFILGIVFLFIIKIPKYVELNNLIIIEDIGVACDKGKYKIYLREIVPLKDDTGISYKYKTYASDEMESLEKAYNNIADKNSKKIFYKDTRHLITNCLKSDEIIDYFKIKPNYIKHTDDNIEDQIRKK